LPVAAQIVGCLRTNDGFACRRFEAETGSLYCTKVVAPRDKENVLPGLRELCTEVAASPTRSKDCDAHLPLLILFDVMVSRRYRRVGGPFCR